MTPAEPIIDQFLIEKALDKATEAIPDRKLTDNQFAAIKSLIDGHLTQITAFSEATAFPFAPAISFLIAAVTMIASSIWAIRLIDVEVPKLEGVPYAAIAMYGVRHLSVLVVLFSVCIPIYKLVAYLFKQYYAIRKYKLLMINRVAIFSTVMLNGGRIEQTALSHFITDIPEPGDSMDTQTLHEKVFDRSFDVLKSLVEKIGKLKD